MLTKLSPTAAAAVKILDQFGIKVCVDMLLAQRAEWQPAKALRVILDNTGMYARVVIVTNGVQHTIVCHGDGVFDLEGPLASDSAGIITGTAEGIVKRLTQRNGQRNPNLNRAQKQLYRALATPAPPGRRAA
jgi:hypothetical protein